MRDGVGIGNAVRGDILHIVDIVAGVLGEIVRWVVLAQGRGL